MEPVTESGRPYISYNYLQMLETGRADDVGIFTLYDILAEASARVSKNPQSKSQLVITDLEPRFHDMFEEEFPDPPDAVPGVGDFGDDTGWPKVGVLKHMGYTVGASDPGQRRRREILARAFDGPIPNVHDSGYMAGWGRTRVSLDF